CHQMLHPHRDVPAALPLVEEARLVDDLLVARAAVRAAEGVLHRGLEIATGRRLRALRDAPLAHELLMHGDLVALRALALEGLGRRGRGGGGHWNRTMARSTSGFLMLSLDEFHTENTERAEDGCRVSLAFSARSVWDVAGRATGY